MFTILIPNINPVAFELGPISIKWYGISYVLSLICCYHLTSYLLKKQSFSIKKKLLHDLFFFWLIFAVIVGGRLGYIFLYDFSILLNNPLNIFAIWLGGMSFHGGLIFSILAVFLFANHYKLPLLILGDAILTCLPLGIFFGRIANFINQEHLGKESYVPWAIQFYDSTISRHPSQIYEAIFEGLIIFFFLLYLYTKTKLPKIVPGFISATFLLCYAITRSVCEFFREPDGYIGVFTLGQLYSIPVFLFSIYLYFLSFRQKHD